jgi:hypothetical protein
MSAVRWAMWTSIAAGVFLAFGWPFVVGPDPSSESFHVAAIATLVALLGSIAAVLATNR